MDVIGLAIARDEANVEITRNLLEAFLQTCNRISVKEAASILCDKDQMSMKRRNYMSACSIFHIDAP